MSSTNPSERHFASALRGDDRAVPAAGDLELHRADVFVVHANRADFDGEMRRPRRRGRAMEGVDRLGDRRPQSLGVAARVSDFGRVGVFPFADFTPDAFESLDEFHPSAGIRCAVGAAGRIGGGGLGHRSDIRTAARQSLPGSMRGNVLEGFACGDEGAAVEFGQQRISDGEEIFAARRLREFFLTEARRA